MTIENSIPKNIAIVRQRIAAAAHRTGRNPEGITLMAVTKTQPPERIVAAYEAGIRSFGENRVQEFAAKREQLDVWSDSTFTLIGQLQSNKVNKAIELFTAIHTIDSLRLAERINGA